MNTDGVILKGLRLRGRVSHPRLLLTEREKAPVVQARQPRPHLILSALHSSHSVNDTCRGSRLVHKPIFFVRSVPSWLGKIVSSWRERHILLPLSANINSGTQW